MGEAEVSRFLCILIKMGEALQNSGAEVFRVEDTLNRIAAAYGAQEVNVFVITSSIVVTLTMPQLPPQTQTRRLRHASGNDLLMLEELNALSRRICAAPPSVEEFQRQLDAILAQHADSRLRQRNFVMEPKTKQYLLVTVVGVTLFVALLRLSTVLAFAAELVDLILPILAGGILALFINVPMSGLEKRLKRLFRKARKQPSDKAIHLISFSITLLGVVLVLVLALTLLIPELVQSFHSLYLQIEANIPRWTAYLSAQNADTGWLMSWLEGINWEQLLHKITASIDTLLINAVNAVSATVNVAVTASFALIISIYMSLGSESLCRHARTLVCAYLKPNHAAGLLKFCRAFRQSFANFLTGQCSEAVILGILMTLAFSVFRIPYGSLVGMLTAICAIIPYVGALISCVVSVFLVLLVDPVLAVRCLIVYLAVQFIENQFIYPRVVGKSVGLSPLYTLVAAMIGGKLFGIIGIIFFIPLTAVILELVKEDACRRLRTKEEQQ